MYAEEKDVRVVVVCEDAAEKRVRGFAVASPEGSS